LDHDHETGRFRGWLCDHCNRALGHLGDNLPGVDRMMQYLLRYSYFAWMEEGGSRTPDPAAPFTRARKNKTPLPTHPMPALCEGCGSPPRGKYKHTLVADHCHAMAAPRGWLCSTCNCALGHLGDDLIGVIRVRDYLLRAVAQQEAPETLAA
jgi:hypothetical protein